MSRRRSRRGYGCATLFVILLTGRASAQKAVISGRERGMVRDLWARIDLGNVTSNFTAELPPHHSRMLRFSPHSLSTVTYCDRASEHYAPKRYARLHCPRHQRVERVVFASFGTPTGSCGQFVAHPHCHSPFSRDVVERACLGHASCLVDASRSLFGDPSLPPADIVSGTSARDACDDSELVVEVKCR